MFGLKKKQKLLNKEINNLWKRAIKIEENEMFNISPTLKDNTRQIDTLKKEITAQNNTIQNMQAQINIYKKQEMCPHYNIYFETDGWIKGCLDCFKVLKAYQTEKEYNDEVIEHHGQANLEMEKKRHKND